MPDLFRGPVGYGGDQFERGTEFSREMAELRTMELQPGETVCIHCFQVHPGECP